MLRSCISIALAAALALTAPSASAEALARILGSRGAPESAPLLPEGWVARPWDGGSISMGGPSGGYLLHGRRIAEEGPGFVVWPTTRERELVFATDELVAAVARAATAVAERHPGPRVVVANLSRDVGGPIEWSSSHESGRDVDFLFYRLDGQGAPVEPEGFHLYRCQGEAEEGDFRFDVPRNWTLVEALLSDPSIEIQYIFVSNCLRRLLLAHARDQADSEALTIRKAEQVLWRPSDAPPHRDHFHVRIYCPLDDLLAGCEDGGRYWDWVETRPEARLARAQQILADLNAPEPTRRREAAVAAGREQVREAAARLPALLDDPAPELRAAAATALVQLDQESSYAPLAARLRAPTTLARLERALSVIVHLDSRGSAWRLEQILDERYEPLEALLPDTETRRRLRRLAARGLTRVGRAPSIPSLIAALNDPDEAIRDTALRALRRLSNQRPAQEATEPEALRAAWERWWHQNRQGSAQRWLIQGFRAAGLHIPLPSWDWNAAASLVALAGAPEELGWNAHASLAHIARRGAVPYHPDAPVRAERWRAWWFGGHRWRAMRDL